MGQASTSLEPFTPWLWLLLANLPSAADSHTPTSSICPQGQEQVELAAGLGESLPSSVNRLVRLPSALPEQLLTDAMELMEIASGLFVLVVMRYQFGQRQQPGQQVQFRRGLRRMMVVAAVRL